jgi:hypothetical protein
VIHGSHHLCASSDLPINCLEFPTKKPKKKSSSESESTQANGDKKKEEKKKVVKEVKPKKIVKFPVVVPGGDSPFDDDAHLFLGKGRSLVMKVVIPALFHTPSPTHVPSPSSSSSTKPSTSTITATTPMQH